MVIKNIRVEEDIWWELSKIKVDKKLKSIEKVIEFLIKGGKII